MNHLKAIWCMAVLALLRNHQIWFLWQHTEIMNNNNLQWYQFLLILGTEIICIWLPVAFFQATTGVGTPWAWQCNVTWRFRSTLISVGSTIHRGGTILLIYKNIPLIYFMWKRLFLFLVWINTYQLKSNHMIWPRIVFIDIFFCVIECG